MKKKKSIIIIIISILVVIGIAIGLYFILNDKDKLNILIIHGSLDGGTLENNEYNPLSRKVLKENIYSFLLYFDKLYIKTTEKNKF